MSESVRIRRLDPEQASAAVPALAELLIDCVEGGASVGFMLPIDYERACSFWRKVAEGVARGERALLVAEDSSGLVIGTAQLLLAMPENQPHRADVAKMLVHRRARRRGVAQALLDGLEVTAREEGRSLLVLDTVSDSAAARLYVRCGWQRSGEIPDYALMPAGGLCPTTVYWKRLAVACRASDAETV